MEIVDGHLIKVLYIDTGEAKRVAAQNLIFTVPTILIIKEGSEMLRESRFIDFHKIRKLIELMEE